VCAEVERLGHGGLVGHGRRPQRPDDAGADAPAERQLYGASEGYQYSHDYAGGISPDQDYLGVDRDYYKPTDRGYEKHITAYLEWAKKLREEAEGE